MSLYFFNVGTTQINETTNQRVIVHFSACSPDIRNDKVFSKFVNPKPSVVLNLIPEEFRSLNDILEAPSIVDVWEQFRSSTNFAPLVMMAYGVSAEHGYYLVRELLEQGQGKLLKDVSFLDLRYFFRRYFPKQKQSLAKIFASLGMTDPGDYIEFHNKNSGLSYEEKTKVYKHFRGVNPSEEDVTNLRLASWRAWVNCYKVNESFREALSVHPSIDDIASSLGDRLNVERLIDLTTLCNCESNPKEVCKELWYVNDKSNVMDLIMLQKNMTLVELVEALI